MVLFAIMLLMIEIKLMIITNCMECGLPLKEEIIFNCTKCNKIEKDAKTKRSKSKDKKTL